MGGAGNGDGTTGAPEAALRHGDATTGAPEATLRHSDGITGATVPAPTRSDMHERLKQPLEVKTDDADTGRVIASGNGKMLVEYDSGEVVGIEEVHQAGRSGLLEQQGRLGQGENSGKETRSVGHESISRPRSTI